MSTTKCVITLVHGTWAKNAGWVQPDSPLSKRLKEAFGPDIVIRSFGWSGRNRFSHRVKAGSDLALCLRALFDDHPDSRHFVIAHSHGGTVAFYATKDAKVHGRLSGICCLATPFIHVRPRDWGPYAEDQTVAGIVSVMMLPLLYSLRNIRLAAASRWESVFWDGLTGILMAGVLAVLLGATWLIDRRIASWEQTVRLPDWFSDRVLLIRATADEALGSLMAAQLFSFLGNRLWTAASLFFGRPIDWIVRRQIALLDPSKHWIRFGAVLLITSSLAQYWGNPWGLVPFGLLFAGLAASLVLGILMTVLILPLALLLSLLLLPFGPGLPIVGLFWDIAAEPTPPGEWRVVHLGNAATREQWFGTKDPGAPPPRARGLFDLMHSEPHVDGRVHDLIVQWIREQSLSSSTAASSSI
jgi:hypothetical protein